jgi:putative transposase
MGLSRSTFYDVPTQRLGEAEIIGRMQNISDDFETYGYRRMGAELRHQGIIVNHKKIRRLMRENDLQPKRKRRYMCGRSQRRKNFLLDLVFGTSAVMCPAFI